MEGVAFGEDIEIGADDFLEEAQIDGAHNFCGDHIFAIEGRESGGGALVEGERAVGFPVHEVEERWGAEALGEVIGGVAEAVEVFAWEIDALTVGKVLADVADDIG